MNLRQPVFIEAKDDGSGGDNWSYKSCKAPVKSSPPTNQHPVFYRLDGLSVTQTTVSKHWREKILHKNLQFQHFQLHSFYRMMLCVSAVFAIARCLSVMLEHCIQKAKDIIKLLSRASSPNIPVSWLPAPIPNSKENPFIGDAKYKKGGKFLQFSTEIAVYLRNGTR